MKGLIVSPEWTKFGLQIVVNGQRRLLISVCPRNLLSPRSRLCPQSRCRFIIITGFKHPFIQSGSSRKANLPSIPPQPPSSQAQDCEDNRPENAPPPPFILPRCTKSLVPPTAIASQTTHPDPMSIGSILGIESLEPEQSLDRGNSDSCSERGFPLRVNGRSADSNQ